MFPDFRASDRLAIPFLEKQLQPSQERGTTLILPGPAFAQFSVSRQVIVIGKYDITRKPLG